MSQITSYAWDEENRLTGVVNPDSSTETYTYAGDGKRRSKDTLDGLISYVWDDENVLQEVDAEGAIKNHYTDYPGYWGGLTSFRSADSPQQSGAQFNTSGFGSVSFNQAGDQSTSGSFFYLFDQQASTRQVLDKSGNVVDEFVYRAFGEKAIESTTTENQHQFQGEVGPFTEALDRVWMRERLYSNATGVWLSVDPSEFDANDWNLYRFVGNNPVISVDPQGLESCKCDVKT